jgi:YD repeat-containing protein
MRRLVVLLASTLLATPAGGWAQAPPPPNPSRPQLDANGVDVQSQQMSYSASMLSIGPKGRGGLDFTLSYNGGAFRNSLNTLLLSDLSGLEQVVTLGPISEAFGGSSGDELALGSILDGNIYYQKDGTKTDFGHSIAVPGITGQQFSYADYTEYPDGTRLTYHYRDDTGGGNPQTRLQSVTTNTGWQFKFNYQANSMTSSPSSVAPWLQITTVVAINNAVEYCDPDADTCSLVNSWPQMSYVTGVTQYLDANGGATNFDISTTNVFKIQTPDSATYNIEYTYGLVTTPGGGYERRVIQALVNGKTTTYSYSYTGLVQTVTSSGPLSQTYTYTANWGDPGITSQTDPLSRTTTYAHDVHRRLTDITRPEGDRTHYEYEDHGYYPFARGFIAEMDQFPKSGGSWSGALHTYWWGTANCSPIAKKTCNSVIKYQDPANGGIPDIQYSDTYGGPVYEQWPANGNNLYLIKRYEYEQRYAWIKDSGGTYVHAPTPLYVRSAERACRNSNSWSGTCAAGPSDETVTTYDYGPDSGPNNLLLRGKVVTSDGVSLRTCYGYDDLGNKISETTANASLGSCP